MRYGLTVPDPGERVAEDLLLARPGIIRHIEVRRIQRVGEGTPAGSRR